MATVLENDVDGSAFELAGDWRTDRAYRFHILVIKENDGAYSAVVLNLPGTGSCGDTEEDAMHNVVEAIRGSMDILLESGNPIPWRNSTGDPIPDGAKQKWIFVNV
jgi:predicted RNase H-like HicB family nuclease